MDLTTLQTRRTEAETALHNILTGSGVQEITSPNGERVVYSQTNVSELRSYIADLTRQIDSACSTPRGPIYVVPDFS